MYASQAWDVVGLLDVAVRNVGGKIEDRDAFIAAIRAAKGFKSVRGDFRFGSNHFPIQSQYARVVTKGADGKYLNRMVGPVLKDHGDAYIGECAMK
jgi:branched-chain amino acid transport system substrate-binding protein